MRWLPPLNALRTFEAVGRLSSFSEAAWELNVTVPAVKHQVRLLEQHLSVDLFARGKAGLVLTPAGRQFMSHVSGGFDQIMQGYRQVGDHEGRKRLVIDAPPGFMIAFLLPRVHRFQEANPDLLLEINTQANLSAEPDFAAGLVDVSIRSGPQHPVWQGVNADKLLHPELVPVCAPSLLRGSIPLKTPADLANHTLLVTRSTGLWENWIAEAEVQGHDMSAINWRRAMYFNQSHMAPVVARQGLGIDLGTTPLVCDDLRSGALVAPFDIRLPVQMAYWLLCSKKSAKSGSVNAFRSWIRKELVRARVSTDSVAKIPRRNPPAKLRVV